MKFGPCIEHIRGHFINFIRNFIINNQPGDIDKTLFVIRNNEIHLKKGEILSMCMTEIVNFSGKIVANYNGIWRYIETGNLLIRRFHDWGCVYIYACEDTIITFDYYIAPYNFVRQCKLNSQYIHSDDFVTGKKLSSKEINHILSNLKPANENHKISYERLNQYFDQKFSFIK